MADRILPTPEQLRELLRYEPETGKLFWLPRPRDMFPSENFQKTWNSRYANKEAFTALRNTGYRHGRVFDVAYQAHRVAWAIYHGCWPEGHIDHVNGDRTDNRLANMRIASHGENLQNRPRNINNTSGYKGVHWDAQRRKWAAKIGFNRISIHLGRFDTPEAAHAAYCEAAKKYHGEFARTE